MGTTMPNGCSLAERWAVEQHALTFPFESEFLWYPRSNTLGSSSCTHSIGSTLSSTPWRTVNDMPVEFLKWQDKSRNRILLYRFPVSCTFLESPVWQLITLHKSRSRGQTNAMHEKYARPVHGIRRQFLMLKVQGEKWITGKQGEKWKFWVTPNFLRHEPRTFSNIHVSVITGTKVGCRRPSPRKCFSSSWQPGKWFREGKNYQKHHKQRFFPFEGSRWERAPTPSNVCTIWSNHPDQINSPWSASDRS